MEIAENRQGARLRVLLDCEEETVDVTYHVWRTRAPREYDGFGTLEVDHSEPAPQGEERIVLIQAEHERWQLRRYASGSHKSKPEDARVAHYLVGLLADRLSG